VKAERPHVWVRTDPRGIARAGLLVEWRQAPLGDWEGRVVVMSGGFHHPAVRVDNAVI
jgi:hypothetical protein